MPGLVKRPVQSASLSGSHLTIAHTLVYLGWTIAGQWFARSPFLFPTGRFPSWSLPIVIPDSTRPRLSAPGAYRSRTFLE
ncbi:hypothetical protein chiPu_0028717, partial [Chiloscyllium punctatum]|nr:hypothetical protein [Chiloscyllium punctatum]